jgi:hypothetical protein
LLGRPQRRSGGPDGTHDILQVADAARQAIDAGDHEDVTMAKKVENYLELVATPWSWYSAFQVEEGGNFLCRRGAVPMAGDGQTGPWAPFLSMGALKRSWAPMVEQGVHGGNSDIGISRRARQIF